MKRLLIAATALVGLAGPAQAAPKHNWVYLNYSTGLCQPTPETPEQFYNLTNELRDGIAVDKIAPADVEKDGLGIHVHMTGTDAGRPMAWDFFTSIEGCNSFAAINDVKPQQAPSADIN